MLDLQGKAMREQAVLREEMQYHYRLGNTEVPDFVLALGILMFLILQMKVLH